MEREPESAVGHHSTVQSLDVNILLTQFGQAMARVGQLEQLCRTLEQRIAELESSLEAAKAAPSDRPDQPAPDIEARLQQKDATIESLRLQLMTAQAELTRAREKLKLAAEGAYMRHRHHHRRWWQFWK